MPLRSCSALRYPQCDNKARRVQSRREARDGRAEGYNVRMRAHPYGSLLAFVRLAAVLLIGWPAAASAQTDTPTPLPPTAVPPVDVMLPNYNGVPTGEIASIEGGAFVARANDTSATYYNPAGLTLAKQTSVSGSAGMFQFTSVTGDGLESTASSFQQIPSLFAVAVKGKDTWSNWAGGLSFARVNAWKQTVDAERSIQTTGGSDRFAYSSGAEFAGWIASLSVGHTNGGKLRVGGSLDGQYTSTDRGQAISDQYRTTTGLNALTIRSDGWAWATHLRLTAGAQYDVTPTVRVGAVFRSAGLGVISSGFTSIEGLSSVGPTTTSASFFDKEGEVQYKIPTEFRGGVSWTGARAQLEADVLTYTGRGQYDAYTSTQPVTIINDPGQGAAPTVQLLPYVPKVVDSRSVVNIAMGGHYNVTSNGMWTLHAGFSTDNSPVGEHDTQFTKINLQNWTAGVSGRTKLFLGSLGLQYTTGVSGVIPLRQWQNGQQFVTSFHVANVGFIYSLAVLF